MGPTPPGARGRANLHVVLGSDRLRRGPPPPVRHSRWTVVPKWTVVHYTNRPFSLLVRIDSPSSLLVRIDGPFSLVVRIDGRFSLLVHIGHANLHVVLGPDRLRRGPPLLV